VLSLDPVTPWREAVELGAEGRYGAARVVLESIPSSAASYSLALSTLGSHARQVGASGIEWDRAALDCAEDAESRLDAIVGLAADAVVAQDARTAHELLAAAGAELDRLGDGHWRSLTRWHWVSAETALLEGRMDIAIVESRAARLSCAGRSARHEAKSMIVAMAAGDDFALGQVDAVAQVLSRRGWASLQWPLALVVADAQGGFAAWTAAAGRDGLLSDLINTARRAVERIAADLPVDLNDSWHNHPGVRRLLDGPVA
jgi:hypothetical protein